MLDMCCAVRDIGDRSEVIGMVPLALTMTLSELNRLCRAYYDATCGKDPKVAEEAWKAYVQYVRRYKDERGLP
jgi:hypothetical protein